MDATGISYEALVSQFKSLQREEIKEVVSALLEQRLSEIESRVEEFYESECISRMAAAIGERDALKLKSGQLEETLEDREKQLKIYEGEKEKLKDDLQKQEIKHKQELACREEKLTGQMADERERLEKEIAERDGRIEHLQERADAEEKEKEGYLWACSNDINGLLPFIETGSYEAYIMSVFNRSNIKCIYELMRQEHESGELLHTEKYERLIDEYIEISRKIRGRGCEAVRRQQVKVGDMYESVLFDKISWTAETGNVTRILYKGLEENGRLLEGCKSLVEVG